MTTSAIAKQRNVFVEERGVPVQTEYSNPMWSRTRAYAVTRRTTLTKPDLQQMSLEEGCVGVSGR